MNRKTYTLCLSRQRITVARRLDALTIMAMETPYGERYAKRRAVINDRMDTMRRALDEQVRTNAAAFMMATRRAFTVGLN